MLRNIITTLVISIVAATLTQAQAGGNYQVTQGAIAGGGATVMSAGHFAMGGTTGQPIAGEFSLEGPYSLQAGFWPQPPAVIGIGLVDIGGRITSLNGAGISKATVTLTGATLTDPRRTITNGFGYYHFADVEAGQIYTVTVASKWHTFAMPSVVIAVMGPTGNVNFVSEQ